MATYKLVSTYQELVDCGKYLSDKSILALDCETTSLQPREGKIRLIQISDDIETFVIDCFNFTTIELAENLRFLEDSKIKLVIQNGLFETKWFKYHLGLNLNSIFDTMLASKLLDYDEEANLAAIGKKYLNVYIDKDEQVSNWGGVLTKPQLDYAADDVKYLISLREVMLKKLIELRLIEACKVEFNLIPAVADMELTGFPVARDRFEEFNKRVEIERDEAYLLLDKFLASAGGKDEYEKTYVIDLFGNELSVANESTINLRSSEQLLKSLHAAGIEVPNTASGTIKIFAQQYPDLNLLLNFRKKEKLCSSFGRKFFATNIKDNDRIYPSFFQLGTKTGRFSAKNPNSQQQPSDKDFRRIFCAPEGYKFIIYDMSQIELRILACFSKDVVMLDAFNTGKDLHSVTTSNIFNIPYEECELAENKSKRQSAKQVSFGIAYGIGASGLCLRLKALKIDTDESQCQRLIDSWYETYQQAGKYLKNQRYLVNNAMKSAKEGQKVFLNLRGMDNRLLRPSFIMGDLSSQAGAKRDCMNFPIQSGSAVSIKRAITNIHRELSENYPESHIVNTIHDEVLVLAPDKDTEAVKEIVERCMVEGGEYYFKGVIIKAEGKIAQDWGEK